MPIVTGDAPASLGRGGMAGMKRPAKVEHGPKDGMKRAKHPKPPAGTQAAVTRVMKRGVRRHDVLGEA